MDERRVKAGDGARIVPHVIARAFRRRGAMTAPNRTEPDLGRPGIWFTGSDSLPVEKQRPTAMSFAHPVTRNEIKEKY
ncbi:MAG: hypothetical protein IPH15_00060 [Comamonadaceae bacterium]|jgi:hypothetical protein|nr:hypothetical protein [Comamonadaceae bacterium]